MDVNDFALTRRFSGIQKVAFAFHKKNYKCIVFKIEVVTWSRCTNAPFTEQSIRKQTRSSDATKIKETEGNIGKTFGDQRDNSIPENSQGKGEWFLVFLTVFFVKTDIKGYMRLKLTWLFLRVSLFFPRRRIFHSLSSFSSHSVSLSCLEGWTVFTKGKSFRWKREKRLQREWQHRLLLCIQEKTKVKVLSESLIHGQRSQRSNMRVESKAMHCQPKTWTET